MLTRTINKEQSRTNVVKYYQVRKATRKDSIFKWLHTLSLANDVYIKFMVKIYYIQKQQDAPLSVLFISYCRITLHVSDAFCVHHQEY